MSTLESFHLSKMFFITERSGLWNLSLLSVPEVAEELRFLQSPSVAAETSRGSSRTLSVSYKIFRKCSNISVSSIGAKLSFGLILFSNISGKFFDSVKNKSEDNADKTRFTDFIVRKLKIWILMFSNKKNWTNIDAMLSKVQRICWILNKVVTETWRNLSEKFFVLLL